MGENIVMVVDDNEDSLEISRLMLELDGYEVATFADARAALAALREMPPPCVIVVDLWMPRVDGATFVEALRRDPGLARLPVILMSSAHPREMNLDLPFFLKPIDPAVLLRTVRGYRRTPQAAPPS